MRKPLDGVALIFMLLVCACWGLQQVAVKVAAPSLNPVLQIGIRSFIGTVLLLLFMSVRNERMWQRDATLHAGIALGVVFAIEFLFVAWGLMHTTASHLVVFLYTAPVFTALGLHWLVPGERLNLVQWSGVLVAFAGIVCAFSGSFFLTDDSIDSSSMLLGDLFGVIAGLLWAISTLIIRTSALSEAPATKTMLYQLILAALILVPVGFFLFQNEPISMTPIAWVSITFQSIVVGFVSLLVWFWLLRRYLASRLSVLSFMTPLFGVTFGVLLLDDPLDAWFVGGAVLVAIGIMLVNVRWRSRA